jgi:hypothetical protein
MPFDFASVKSLARRTVNATFGVRAFYTDDSVSAVELRARLHNRLAKPYGDLTDGAGYAEVIEGIDRIVLIPEDLSGFPITLKRGGVMTFPDTHPGQEFVLDVQEPDAQSWPEVAWQVSKK